MASALTAGDRRNDGMEIPEGPIDDRVGWGSDVAAEMLRRLGIEYISLNPGASYRGLHDSIVNHLGNRDPQMILCLHEEQAVAIAQGYAKVTGKAMAVALHSNVGLMHGMMAIFNAWCDRVPMLIIGATGPIDASLRRPWIDWIHTTQDQASMLRQFIKWDDQPGSATATAEAMLRAYQITNSEPQGPVYVCLDAAVQEAKLDKEVKFGDVALYKPLPPPRPDADAVAEAVRLISAAKRPLIVYGQCRRTQEAFDARVALAVRMNAQMASEGRAGSVVPTDHPLYVGTPMGVPSGKTKEAFRQADLIVSLGRTDLGGMLRVAFDGAPSPVPVISSSLDYQLHNGWGKEYLELPAVTVNLNGDPDAAVADLLAAVPDRSAPLPPPQAPGRTVPFNPGKISLRHVAQALAKAVGDQPVTLAATARGWPADLWRFKEPLSHIGSNGGGGVGGGPGITIGAGLALRDSGRLVVGVVGDGDCMMCMNALWTAAHYSIPVLLIVSNNTSYFNDEEHQETVALHRGRNPRNRWIGQRTTDPATDLAKIAEAQGLAGIGPIESADQVVDAIERAVAIVRSGRPCLVDVRIDPVEGRAVREAAAERVTAG